MNIELVKLGMEKHRSKDYVTSIKYFTQAIAEDPNDLMNLQLYLGIGEAKFKLSDYPGSVDAYTKGLNFYNLNIKSFNQQHPQIVESTKTVLEQAYRIRANAKKELGDYQGAIQDYNKSIDMNGTLSDSIYSRGVAYMETDNFAAAKADFARVIEMNPNDAPAYRNLGNAKFRLGDFSGAVSDYSMALSRNIAIEHRGEVYNNRGSALAQLGQYQHAASDFEKALEINPYDPVALANKKDIQSFLGAKSAPRMSPTDLTNLKEAITFELGMTLTGMFNSKRYSTLEIIDIGAYIGAHFTQLSHVKVFQDDKEEVVKHIFSIYNQMFATGITATHLERIKGKYYELLMTDHKNIEAHLQKIISTFIA
jgi:tetratricopeptide (TPR) repeat protein